MICLVRTDHNKFFYKIKNLHQDGWYSAEPSLAWTTDCLNIFWVVPVSLSHWNSTCKINFLYEFCKHWQVTCRKLIWQTSSKGQFLWWSKVLQHSFISWFFSTPFHFNTLSFHDFSKTLSFHDLSNTLSFHNFCSTLLFISQFLQHPFILWYLHRHFILSEIFC